MSTDPTTQTGQSSTLVQPTGNPLTDALIVGSRWGGGSAGQAATLSFAFPATVDAFDRSPDVAGNYHPQEPLGNGYANYLQGFAPFAAPATDAARQVLAAWATVARLGFIEVAADAVGAGTLRFAYSAPPGLGTTTFGVSAFPQDFPAAGDTWINAGFLYPDGWTPGTQNFLTLLHEVGHALGLKHPHDTGLNGAPGWPATPVSLPKVGDDTLTEYSTEDMVMAYNDLPGIGAPVQADFAPTTPMRVDIAAIQYLYGANLAHEAGDTVYTFAADGRYNQTVWDGGGNDTFRATGAADVMISLVPGSWSRLGQPLTYSERGPDLAVARARPDLTDPRTVYIYDTVTIENAIGGDGRDTLLGNRASNRLQGGAGDDTLDGGEGIDIAVYAAARSGCSIVRTQAGWTVASDLDGLDTLTGIERLRFADLGLALDTAGDGRAGQAAQILRGLFGSAAVHNPTIAGLGLGLLDQGMDYATLVQLAIGTPVFEQLAGSRANGDFVRLLWKNVIGSEPGAADMAGLVAQLDSGALTQAALGVAVCQHALNASSAELVGIAQAGLEYIPMAGGL